MGIFMTAIANFMQNRAGRAVLWCANSWRLRYAIFDLFRPVVCSLREMYKGVLAAKLTKRDTAEREAIQRDATKRDATQQFTPKHIYTFLLNCLVSRSVFGCDFNAHGRIARNAVYRTICAHLKVTSRTIPQRPICAAR